MSTTQSREVRLRDEPTSRWEIVARQFARNRTAVWGLRATVALVLLAIYAPVVASSQPLLWREPGGALESPWLASLFDRNTWEHGLDRFFNLLMFPTTVWLLAVGLRALRVLPRAGARARRAWRGLRLTLVGCTLAVALLQGAFGVLVTSRPTVDYRARAAELDAAAAAAGGAAGRLQVGTPIPYGYREQLPTREDRFRSFLDFERGQRHLLGTDELGRDVFARILYGTRISLTVGVVAVALYVFIGTVLGALAGYFGGRIDLLIMRFVEIVICIPGLFLILTIIALFENHSIFLIMAAIGLVGWTGITRLVRGEFLRERHIEYVEAARVMGFSTPRILFRHILPNALGPVFVAATFGIAAAILTESTLAFIGLGDITVPSWGRILDDGRRFQYWHLILPPAFAIFVTVTALNLVGDGLRDALDPKLRG